MIIHWKNTLTTPLKVKIICEKHGIFEQTPAHHMRGNGCQLCSENKKMTNGDFIGKVKEIHGNRYDYSLVEYTNSNTKVKIICEEHGEF